MIWGAGGAMQSFQCNDIMAYNTKEEDDVLSKQAEFLCELYGRWETKQEMGKMTYWMERVALPLYGSIDNVDEESKFISLHFDKL